MPLSIFLKYKPDLHVDMQYFNHKKDTKTLAHDMFRDMNVQGCILNRQEL